MQFHALRRLKRSEQNDFEKKKNHVKISISSKFELANKKISHIQFNAFHYCVLFSHNLYSCGSRRPKANSWCPNVLEFILPPVSLIQGAAQWRNWLVPRNFNNLRRLPSSRYGNNTHGLCSGNPRKGRPVIRDKLQFVSFYWWCQLEDLPRRKRRRGITLKHSCFCLVFGGRKHYGLSLTFSTHLLVCFHKVGLEKKVSNGTCPIHLQRLGASLSTECSTYWKR